MNLAHFCEFWCSSLGKSARFTSNFGSRVGLPGVTPDTLSVLLRKWPVLLRADFVLTKDTPPRAALLQDPSLSSRESNRPQTPIFLKSIAIHVPFLSRDTFAKVSPSSWKKVVYIYIHTTNLYYDAPPICITMLLQKYQGQGSLAQPQGLFYHKIALRKAILGPS